MVSSRSAKALGLAVAAVTVLVPAVAGCEAGTNSPTQRWHQSTPGASARVSDIVINNVFVVGAPPTTTLPAGSSAGLFLALANDGGTADRLISITAPGAARSVLLPKGGVSLASQEAVFLQGPSPQVVLQRTTRSLNGGTDIPVVLDFQNAGRVKLQVPVMPRAGDYATFSAAPASPTARPSTARPRHTGRTPTPSPSPTA